MTALKSHTLIIRRNTAHTPDIHAVDAFPLAATTMAARRSVNHHGINFRPGQVAILQTAKHKPAYFAFASAPEDAELEFLIKRGSLAANALADLKAGDEVQLVDVIGKGFPLDSLHGRDLVLIAMGTGIAPLRSVLRHALTRRADFGKLVMLYGARTPIDFAYTAEAETWRKGGAELRQVISRPDGHEWDGSTGYVQSLLDNLLPQLTAPVALVCGSTEMITHTRERLLTMGFASEDVLTNY